LHIELKQLTIERALVDADVSCYSQHFYSDVFLI